VANFCPLLFLEASGRNRTPDALRGPERAALLDVCRRHLRRLVDLLEPEWLVGVGAFAAEQAREALAGSRVRIARILHPSPANPRAGARWGLRAARELADQGVCPR
jgi:single-strand selective monofunctional uracil DNA glycosylase